MRSGQFSPDARWIAYVAERPNTQVYVRPFSPNAGAGATGARYLVSRGLASFPRWRADGAQLFFITGVLDLMAVEVNTKAGFQAGTPQRLFAAPPPLAGRLEPRSGAAIGSSSSRRRTAANRRHTEWS